MARTRDQEKFNQCRDSLLAVGEQLFINSSFNNVGLNDILREAGIPKGSFYHYFESKEDFGLQVVGLYHRKNKAELEKLLADDSLTPYQQLKTFFENTICHFDDIGYCQGCLMANLSQELADVNEKLRCELSGFSREMAELVTEALERLPDDPLGLGHLNPRDAAQVLLNSWQGAIMKMKLEKSRKPLEIFMQFFFSQ